MSLVINHNLMAMTASRNLALIKICPCHQSLYRVRILAPPMSRRSGHRLMRADL